MSGAESECSGQLKVFFFILGLAVGVGAAVLGVGADADVIGIVGLMVEGRCPAHRTAGLDLEPLLSTRAVHLVFAAVECDDVVILAVVLKADRAALLLFFVLGCVESGVGESKLAGIDVVNAVVLL